MNWFGKKVSKVNRLEPSESAIILQTNGRHYSHLMNKSSICISLGFSTTKCFISFRQRLEMSKGNSTFCDSKCSEWPSKSYPGAEHTWFKLEIWPAAKDYYGLFGRAMLEVQKNLVLIFLSKLAYPRQNSQETATQVESSSRQSYHEWKTLPDGAIYVYSWVKQLRATVH